MVSLSVVIFSGEVELTHAEKERKNTQVMWVVLHAMRLELCGSDLIKSEPHKHHLHQLGDHSSCFL